MCYHIQLRQPALKEPLDSKEALPLEDVWRSATTMSGAQCVMTYGGHLMPKLLADSWDSQVWSYINLVYIMIFFLVQL